MLAAKYLTKGLFHIPKVSISMSRAKREERTRKARQMRKQASQVKFPKVSPLARKSIAKPIPLDNRPLKGLYRSNLELVEEVGNPEVIQALSLENSGWDDIKAVRFQKIIQRYGEDPYDTGNSAVQVGCLTERIIALSRHLRTHNKDVSAFLTLRKKLDQRRKMMSYLSRTNYYMYERICHDLGIKQIEFAHPKW